MVTILGRMKYAIVFSEVKIQSLGTLLSEFMLMSTVLKSSLRNMKGEVDLLLYKELWHSGLQEMSGR